MSRKPPTVPCDRHRWHRDFYAGMGCRHCRATLKGPTAVGAACYAAGLTLASVALAGLLLWLTGVLS